MQCPFVLPESQISEEGNKRINYSDYGGCDYIFYDHDDGYGHITRVQFCKLLGRKKDVFECLNESEWKNCCAYRAVPRRKKVAAIIAEVSDGYVEWPDGWSLHSKEAIHQAADRIMVLIAEDRRELVMALGEAAQSLETLSSAGLRSQPLIYDMWSVRGYANSRATVARAALRSGDGAVSKTGDEVRGEHG